MLQKLKNDLEKGGFGQSHASGFSLGDSDLDRVKRQARDIQGTYQEEKKISDNVFKDQ